MDYSDRVTFASIPTVNDLEMAEKADGVLIVHIGNDQDEDVVRHKRGAVLTLIGLPEDHPLLTRLVILNGPDEKIAEWIQEKFGGTDA